ncbi:immunity protein [Pectobacterium carotovorum]|uniref:immunity protein n=1 Tax=Pectobacterium carotovorum TaxID=554 RepID=UPI0029D5D912|nr:immunity protein [Pectobacterium carotovorum]MDX6914706.1 immunity protein [Pectobacterium carotovorum]
MANKIGIKTLLILITSFTVFIALTVLLIRLGIASVFFFKDGFFYFSWQNGVIDSARKGLSGGIPLGVGIWIMSRLKANKDK